MWNTDGFALVGNEIHDVRDGFYIQSSPHGVTSGNTASDLRYGLHYMFSDDNVFEDNRFENGAAGAALMYSRRLTFRRNRFVHNRGFASVGLLLKTCDDVLAEDNLIADNARGLFVEGAIRNVFRRNIIAESDVALVLYDSNIGVRFEGNSFVANLSPLQLVGRRTDTVVRGNYWSDQGQPDLDGDGVADQPYRLSSAFDHLRGNLTAADLFAQGVAAHALGVAERTFPVIDLVPVVDERPLAHPPRARRGAGRVAAQPEPADRRLALDCPPRRCWPAPGPASPDIADAVSGPRRAQAVADVCARRRRPAMIAFDGFSKRFGTHDAVIDLTLTIAAGEAVALLGPNGSGKTTSIKAAAGPDLAERGFRPARVRPACRPPTRPRGGSRRSCRSACRFPTRCRDARSSSSTASCATSIRAAAARC